MMNNRKRNLTMLAVMMFVCAAVALNWSYNSRWGKPNAEMVYAEDEAMQAAQMDFEKTLMTSGTEYFAEARLTRQVSRDEALELLQTAASSESASQDTIDGAMYAISNMAACSMQEAQIENLLLAKNFEDCVVYIGAEKVTVAVPAPVEGLSEEAVARITEVICSETDYGPTQLSIIEVKA
jgi:stage III sporulation protein AH